MLSIRRKHGGLEPPLDWRGFGQSRHQQTGGAGNETPETVRSGAVALGAVDNEIEALEARIETGFAAVAAADRAIDMAEAEGAVADEGDRI